MLFIHVFVSTQDKTSHPVSCSSSKFEAFHSDPCKRERKCHSDQVYFLFLSFFLQKHRQAERSLSNPFHTKRPTK